MKMNYTSALARATLILPIIVTATPDKSHVTLGDVDEDAATAAASQPQGARPAAAASRPSPLPDLDASLNDIGDVDEYFSNYLASIGWNEASTLPDFCAVDEATALPAKGDPPSNVAPTIGGASSTCNQKASRDSHHVMPLAALTPEMLAIIQSIINIAHDGAVPPSCNSYCANVCSTDERDPRVRFQVGIMNHLLAQHRSSEVIMLMLAAIIATIGAADPHIKK